MGDVDYPDTFSLELPHCLKKYFCLFVGEGSCRLIHYENISLNGHSFCDLDHLLLGYAQVLNQRVRVKVQPQTRKHLLGLFVLLSALDDSRNVTLTSQEHIFSDRQVRNEAKLLMNYADAVSLRVRNALHDVGFTVDDDLALFRDVDTGQALNQRRFSCSVFP